jgi:YD repeat-containing protein
VVSYDLDGAANRLSERIVDQNQALIAEKRYRYNIRDQLERIDDAISGESTSYGYNAIGQQIHKTDTQGTTQYQYNSRRRLSTITLPNQQIEQHQYDDQGLRVSTEFNGTRKHYRYDGQSLIQETNVQGNLIARYTWSDQGLISENRNGLQTYLHTDALATPITITDTSAAVVDRYRYDAWGNTEQHQGTSQQPFGFTGYQFDLSKINVFTIKLAPGSGQGAPFPACTNCAGILSKTVNIRTGVK